MGLLLAGALLFAADWEADRQKQAGMDSFRDRLADLALISETIISEQVHEFDNSLLVLRDAYVADPKRFAENIRLMRSGPLADLDILVVLVDRDGYLAYTDTPNVKPHIYLGDRKYFRFFADGGKDSLYIGEPTFGRVTNRYILPLARPMYDGQGRFLGVVALSVKQDSIASFGPRLQLSRDTTVTVVNHGGAVVSRSRDFLKVLGTKIPSDLLTALLDGPEGIFLSRPTADGPERFIAHRHIHSQETPLIVYVEVPSAEMLRQFTLVRTVLVLGAGFTSLMVMGLLMVFLNGRKTSLQLVDTLRRNKAQEYETLTGTTLDGFLIVDTSARILDANDTFCKMLGYTGEEILGLSVMDIEATDSPEQIAALLRSGMKTGSDRFHSRYRRKEGSIIDVEISAQYVDGAIGRYFVFVRDITELYQAEEERKSHLRFLESLGQVDRVIKQEADLEQMLWDVVRTVFSIFDCDRAWLLFPCNPDAPSYRIPVEVSRPEFPGATVLNVDVLMSPGEAWNMREALESDGPVMYIAGTERPPTAAEMFGVQSQMIVPVYPKLGEPWMFGMHQCSFPRIWTEAEKNLFQEIARRVSDGLSNVLYLRELHENEERFRATFEQAAVGIAHVAPNGRWLRVNRKLCDIVGYQREELLRKSFQDITYHDDLDADLEHFRQVLAGETRTGSTEMRYICKDGSIVWSNLTVSMVHDASNDPAYFIAVIEDISERKQAEENLQKSEGHLRTLVQTIPDLIWLKDPDGVYLSCNQKFERFFGAGEAEVVGKTDYQFVDRELADFFREHDRKAIAAGKPTSNEEWVTFADGHRVLLETIKTPMYNDKGTLIGVLGIGRDITERKRAEEEKIKLEAQLQQAQKMDAIGQLAGGVAHDFNNMLGVILGHAEMAMDLVEPSQPLYADLEEIRKAATRSADITRQLLAFARRQTVAPQVIDLNETIEGMLKMLRRLIGEDIDLAWLPGAGLWPVKMDPSQVDQILANLCVNARGAIAGVGKITVETGNRTFDKDYCDAHAGFIFGDYVRISVSDSGCGMDKETLAHIFEPFFTTKGVGEGTGLGLAMVYGAVKQNNGFINAYSEPGRGTTFTLYLPRQAGEAGQLQRDENAGQVAGGDETVLLVEDEPTILKMTTTMLKLLGYTVLAAATPGDAIRLAGTHTGEIHLLLTDVIMPEMNGRDLAEKMLLLHPRLKCLFMSGYTSDVISRHGTLDEGVHFIQKPFVKKDLAIRVRMALEKT
jgi:PAS domain S-box-containing protein